MSNSRQSLKQQNKMSLATTKRAAAAAVADLGASSSDIASEEEEEEEALSPIAGDENDNGNAPRYSMLPAATAAATVTTNYNATAAARNTEEPLILMKPPSRGKQLKLMLPNHRKQQTPEQRNRKFFKEVQKLQNSNDFLIPRLPFSRLVRELLMSLSSDVKFITKEAFEALQTACEMYLTQQLHDAYMLTLHRNRVTLTVTDMRFLRHLFSTINLHR